MRRILAALAVVAALAAPARADFVLNNTSLVTNKQDLFPTPIGANPLNYITAADYNAAAQAAIDLRSAITGVTSGFALTLGDGASLGVCAAGKGCLRYNNTSHAFEQSVNGGSWAGFGGGGSTGNWTFSGNNADVASGFMGIGTSTAGGINLGGANTPVQLGSNLAGTGYTTTNNYIVITASAAAAGATLKNTSPFYWQPHYWTGAADATYNMSIVGVMDSTTPTAHLSFQMNGSAVLNLNQIGTLYPATNNANALGASSFAWSNVYSGAFSLIAGGSLGNISQGATNTTAMTIAPNVADGASSIGLVINNVTALTSGKMISFQNGGVERAALIALAPGYKLSAGAGTAMLEGNTDRRFYVDSVTDGFGMSMGGGGEYHRWDSTKYILSQGSMYVSAPRYVQQPQAITATATTTIPITDGFVKLNLQSATNVTSLTVAAGVDGETMVVEIVQPAAGTAATVPTTWTNVSFAGGTFTNTATLGKRDEVVLQYDGTTSKWYERSRAMNLAN